jgi:glucose/arabinose dehydrogenase
MLAGRVLLLGALIGCSSTVFAQTPLGARVYASGFTAPLAFVQDPSDPSVQFVVEQGGRIRVVRSGALVDDDFLDLRGSIVSGGEQGLLGLAFQPDAGSGVFFVNFTDRSGNTVVARFRRSSNPLVADAASRFDLRWGGGDGFIRQPFANHNGGNLVFGPDGFLYIGMGDGGSGDDPDHRAQNPQELLGKILRIDVRVGQDHPIGYVVPPDNPFVGQADARPEIWDFGLRNPWRFSFDDPSRGGSGALVIGDVGQNHWEEIDYEPRQSGGRNYGWRNREGAHDNVTARPPAFLPLVDPVFEYDHNVGQSITGGYIYRGTALGPEHVGRYFFADFVQGRVWSLTLTPDAGGTARASNLVEHTGELGGTTQIGNVSSFGLDAAGELYLVSHSQGAVFRITGPVAAPPTPLNPRIIPGV